MPKTKIQEKADVLLVDDQPANLVSLEALLEAPHLNLIQARSGEEALEIALNSRPALVLLDVQMPGMDGFEVARLLRGKEGTRNIPIIFVTATHRDEKFTFQGFESGAVDYLFKPLNPVIVRSKVNIFVELYQSRRSLEEALEELSLANQELESFAYSVSHDLKAPARSVIGFSQGILDDVSGGKAVEREDLERILAAGQRMDRTIDSLLQLSRITGLAFEPGEVDLSALAGRIVDELRQETPLTVACEIKAGMCARADEHLMEVALRNLLGNAWKYTSKKDSARVEFDCRKSGKDTVYFIRDNGVGFEMENQHLLFRAFQRFHSNKEYQGSGIGLATVQRIIHRHGGKIWAEARPDEGATFYFTLPG